jgi:DtxR family transcriptional regulator, Mn-dependent transcriptional regulator
MRRKMTDQVKPSQTIEDYLCLMYIIERDNEPVIGARLAELLSVTPPTVTNTLKRMARDGLITMDESGTHLTPNGWQSARLVLRKHMLMEWMMKSMLPWSRLHTEAHNLEHAISDDAENALDEELGHPKTCPHGNPLPGFEDLVKDYLPLTQIPIGQKLFIRRIHELAEQNTQMMDYLEQKGVLIGKEVTLSEVLEFNHTLTILVGQTPVILGFAVAKYIYAEPEK